MSTPAIHLINVAHQYPGGPRIVFPDWQVGVGARTLVRGPSGCGKSTLLSVLAGLTAPQQGDVRVLGTDLRALNSAARDAFRARHVALVPQRIHLVAALNVECNLKLAMGLTQRTPNRTEIADALATLGVVDRKDAMPHTLSAGEAQRVAIARALLVRPKLLLADEPTSALDDHHAQGVLRLLTDAASRADATLVIVTHDQRLTALLPTSLVLASPQSAPLAA